jgi:asparagine synthase (glutamine-hydrolysing)
LQKSIFNRIENMCGFAGVIAWDERYRVSKETLAKMSAAIAHRGPDGEGFHINHDHNITPENPQVALAFRRLAILDPDPRSNQPFTDGRHWLVFNGEIYNFRELKKELSILKPEYEWRTTGDTEVLLCAYSVWGEKCVEHLNGMFAFAVWDEVKRELFCSIDRMGQKPLYFAAITTSGKPWTGLRPEASKMDNDGNEMGEIQPPLAAIGFASELPALRVLPWLGEEIDLAAIAAYLRWGYIPAPVTSWVGIRKFSPSTKGSISQASVRTKKYFKGAAMIGAPRPFDAVNQTYSLVRQAVERQLVSDVPVGCFLSGGVDSSIIAACMTLAEGSRKVVTFGMGFDDSRYDESEHATAMAEYLGTEHHQFVVSPEASADLPKLAQGFGEPFGDSSALPSHYLARETKQCVKTCLSGDGGDELFGGYQRYQAMQKAATLDTMPASFRRWAASEFLQRRLSGHHPKSTLTKLKRFLATADVTTAERYLSLVSLFDRKKVDELFKQEIPLHHNDWSLSRAITQLFDRKPPATAAAAVDRLTYLPCDLLTKVDRCSMLHGLEVRSPFMDHELVQFAAGLTTDQLLKGGPKRMLREAFKDDLPAWVFKRKKMGFAVPIGDWFRGPLRAMLRDTLFSSHAFGREHFDMKVVERLVEEHETKKVDHSQRLYALLMLELWWNTVRT